MCGGVWLWKGVEGEFQEEHVCWLWEAVGGESEGEGVFWGGAVYVQEGRKGVSPSKKL
jgi:hypothetical protein